MIHVETAPHAPAVEGVWKAIFELSEHYQSQLAQAGETPARQQNIQHQLSKLNQAIARRRQGAHQ